MGNKHMGNTNGDSAFNKRTIAAALANYIDAGSIVAGFRRFIIMGQLP